MSRMSQLAVNDEGFVFDPTTGDSYQVNAVGLFILKQLRDGGTPQSLPLALQDRYEVDAEDAYADATDFLGRLKQFGLI